MKKSLILDIIKRYWLTILLPIALIILYYSPFLYYGNSSPILIHDNLDSNLVWAKTLLSQNAFWSAADFKIDQIINGIYRFNLYGVFDFNLLFFQLFGFYYGYVICKISMAIVAYLGMRFLLLKLGIKREESNILITSSALLFAILPFWSFTFSVAAMPLVSYVFLELRSGKNSFWLFFLLILFSFFSSLPLVGMFILLVFSIIWLYDLLFLRRHDKYLFFGLALLSIGYILSHLPMVMGILTIKDFVSSRVEMDFSELNYNGALKKFDYLFRYGQYHAHSLHTPFIIPIFLALIIRIFQRKWKLFVLILSFILLTSVFYAILNFGMVREAYLDIFAVLPIQLQRFHFLHPMLWYILLAMSLETIYSIKIIGKPVAFLIVFIQAAYIIGLNPFSINTHVNKMSLFSESNSFVTKYDSLSNVRMINHNFDKDSYLTIARANNLIGQNYILDRNAPLFDDFYDVEQFDKIKKVVDEDLSSFRVISLGIHPAIAQFNGFYTLDAYLPNYDLKYKHEFRQIIENEIANNPSMTYYFDKWGSRCYAFSNELGFGFLNPNRRPISEPKYNYEKFKAMGGKYIISSAEIMDTTLTNLDLVQKFGSQGSFWNLHLYQVK